MSTWRRRGGLALILTGALSICAASPVLADATADTLHVFKGKNGAVPYGRLAVDEDGALYGATSGGNEKAVDVPYSGGGLVYKLIPTKNGAAPWRLKILHKFDDAEGSEAKHPQAGVVRDPATGELFGTTTTSDAGGGGTVFRLTPPKRPDGDWAFSVLTTFSDFRQVSLSELLLAPNGKIYGASSTYSRGCGEVFELSPPRRTGGKWSYKIILGFDRAPYGCFTLAALVMDAQGALYGNTREGGDPSCQCGAIFKLQPPKTPGGAWKSKIIYSFKGQMDGSGPQSGMIFGSSGKLYGTTRFGGLAEGTIFELSPPRAGSAKWKFRVIRQSDGDLGFAFEAPLSQDANGALYGTGLNAAANSVVFKLSPPAAGSNKWKYAILAQVPDGAGRASPVVPASGALFGVAELGGDKICNCGLVYRIRPDGD